MVWPNCLFCYLMKSLHLMIHFSVNLTNIMLGDAHHSGLYLTTTMLYPSDLCWVDVCSWAEGCLFCYWVKVMHMLIVTIRQGAVAVVVVYMPSGKWVRNTL